ncbi:hypothetical protein PoB_001739500 [Plakobranchus ocellatus]|uniref:Secreted protein n=1 Tax=Plakobranchus ocellatus TaxID=259542 RepID=A0AAV3Z5Z8_9GAST|nr:hypothetical protein PoB_001739500 [Plakobranchus ocellatus]
MRFGSRGARLALGLCETSETSPFSLCPHWAPQQWEVGFRWRSRQYNDVHLPNTEFYRAHLLLVITKYNQGLVFLCHPIATNVHNGNF